MEKEELKNELERIARQSRTTQQDKDLVREACRMLDIALPTNTRCANCWLDKAMECFVALKKDEPKIERKWVLRDGVDVYFQDERINRYTLASDEMAEELIARGFSKRMFK